MCLAFYEFFDSDIRFLGSETPYGPQTLTNLSIWLRENVVYVLVWEPGIYRRKKEARDERSEGSERYIVVAASSAVRKVAICPGALCFTYTQTLVIRVCPQTPTTGVYSGSPRSERRRTLAAVLCVVHSVYNNAVSLPHILAHNIHRWAIYYTACFSSAARATDAIAAAARVVC